MLAPDLLFLLLCGQCAHNPKQTLEQALKGFAGPLSPSLLAEKGM